MSRPPPSPGEKSREELIREFRKLQDLRQEVADNRTPEPWDISELAASVSLLEATLESTADGILVVDSRGRQVTVNSRFKEIWGFQAEDSVSLDHEEALAVVLGQLTDPDGFLRKVGEVYANPGAESFDILDFQDGRCFERTSRPRLLGGKPQGRVWSFRDVTDRVRAENELRQSKQHLELVMSSVPAFIAYVDADRRYQFVNEQYARTFRCRREDIIGRRIAEVIGQETYAKVAPYIEAALKGQGQHYEVEMHFETLGTRSINADYTPDVDADGTVRGFHILATDVTERVKAQDELHQYRSQLEEMVRHRTAQLERARDEAQRANQAKREFLARMSHEIRTPLNGVIGLAGLLARSDLPPRESDYVAKLIGSADALLHLVNEILDFSKIEAGKLVLEEGPFHAGGLLRETRNLLAPLAAEKGVALEVSGEELGWYTGDRARIRQVLLNLVGNAIKFTEKGRIDVTAEEEARDGAAPGVRWTVRDTGVGIPEESLPLIFQQFERMASADRDAIRGTGLGLAISKALVELMGGEIDAESTPGEGSVFSFTIPLSPAEEPDADDKATTAAGLGGLRILVAEDNPVNQLVIQRVLEDLGHVTRVAGNGREALEALADDTYDVLVLDCRMPEVDGYETARRIRAGEGGQPELPIIALTANASRQDLEMCLEAGMDHYLSKPFATDDLVKILEELRPPSSVGLSVD